MLFDFGYTLPKRAELRVRRLGKLRLPAPAGQLGLRRA